MTYLRPGRQPPTALLYRVFEIINSPVVCVQQRGDGVGSTRRAGEHVRPIKGAVTRAVNLIESLTATTNSRVFNEPLDQ